MTAESTSHLLRLLRVQSLASRLLKEPAVDLGLAEIEPLPILAKVGQEEMKLALQLAIVIDCVGGVL